MEVYCDVCKVLCGDGTVCYDCVASEKLALSEIHVKELQSKLAFLRFQSDNLNTYDFGTPDVKIVVQDDRDGFVYAQKHILSLKSAVFCKMFKETYIFEETEVCIEDASLPAMRAVVKFCYDGEITFTVDEVAAEDLLEAAYKYEIFDLLNICEEDLLETLDHENWLKRLKLATKFGVTRLKTAATEYFKYHYDTLISSVLEELC